MKMQLRRVQAWILVMVMVIMSAWIGAMPEVKAAEGNTTSRAIYVVYDNSGSMYTPGNMAWSQANYAMEVFANMLNFDRGDMMKVFPMHNVTTAESGGTEISTIEIKNHDDIKPLHTMFTPKWYGTPYETVEDAYAELLQLLNNNKADEGWLLILTDGEFQKGPENALVPQKTADIRKDLLNKVAVKDNLSIQYLAVGSEFEQPLPESDENSHFYVSNASCKKGEDNDIMHTVAAVCNQIFNRNEIVGYKNGDTLQFDIPLKNLFVFAQGDNIQINSLKSSDGSKEVKRKEMRAVSYNETDGAAVVADGAVSQTPTKDDKLKGQVAVFENSDIIPEGDYILDISGADAINLYYEPDVKFSVELYRDGEKMEGDSINGGSYTLKVGFVNQTTGKFIEKSELIGDAEYRVKINGEEQTLTGENGAAQELSIEANGETLSVEADVTYLGTYTDRAEFECTVNTLELQMNAPKTLPVRELEEESNQIVVTATKNGQPLTQEQWDAAEVTVSSLNEEGEEFGILWDVEKGSQVSTWVLQPKYKDGDMFKTEIGQMDLTVNVTTMIDERSSGSSAKAMIQVKDNKSIVDYIKEYWPQMLAALIVLILVLGYVPPFKKRFSRKIKNRPSIECTSKKIGVNSTVVKGTFEKNKLSVFLPYTPEVGRLTFSPAPVKKTAKLRASGGTSMWLLNTKAFAGKNNITFNGMPIPENHSGKFSMSAGTILAVDTPEFTYTCIPNVQKTADGNLKIKKKKKK